MRIRSLADGVLSPAEATMQALLAQANQSQTLPCLLSYAPVAEMNPFQRLLYSRASEEGFALVPAVDFEHLAPVGWAGRSVIHLHWLASVLAGAVNMEEARIRIAAFRKRLVTWRSAGHRLVWTMHNVLPHESTIPEAEIALRQAVAEQADAIHLLSRASADEASNYYDLPSDKAFHVPHPSYEGWYANTRDRMSARMDLMLSENEFTFVAFGSLQRYKGLVELVDAFALLNERRPDRPMRLLIAGKAVDPDYLAELMTRVEHMPSVRLIPSAMEERQVQTLLNGADAAVAPYLRTLNSGAALLAATFRRPLVAPKVGGVAETFAPDPRLLYSGKPGDTLDAALERALEMRPDDDVYDRILDAHRPAEISRAFFIELRGRGLVQVAGGGVA
ncbi:glycosyltransferase [Luteimonas viscosa]|uniref:Glycosyltransferase n=1 Tax=Luteimonas viscosa TaxID=1132694 RepID=A0A5D4XQZ8_9GAMM|nr:glycosyltransferase [Luteimonas viscosa]TYT27128.1 glycosyltransferase [Luteimonas viscosa]